MSEWHPSDGDRICQACGEANPVWFTSNAVWNRVMGGPDATQDPGGVLCPLCFIERAEQVAGRPKGWVITPEDGSL